MLTTAVVAALLATAAGLLFPAGGFEEALGAALPERVISTLSAAGIESPTAIQRACLEPLGRGESGIMAAETGSGKSLAFLLPTISRLASSDDPEACIVLAAPTRELCLQLSTEVATLLEAFCGEARVELLVVGSTTSARALIEAQCVAGTPKELVETFAGRPRLIAKLGKAGALILDEVDALLPPPPKDRRSRASKERTKKKRQPTEKSDAARLTSMVLKANPSVALQIIGASATASRTTRDALRKALREDPYGRFVDGVDVFRAEADDETLRAKPRAVVVPRVVDHFVATCEKGASLERTMRRAADVLEALRPQSTLVFLAESAGIAVGPACEALRGVLDRPVAALHDVYFRTEEEDASKIKQTLEKHRRDLLADFRNRDAPVLVTFEESARGLHFDNCDLVLVVGLPKSPDSYLHLAGRTGRRFKSDVSPGSVCLLVPDKALAVLQSWSSQLGGVTFARFDDSENLASSRP